MAHTHAAIASLVSDRGDIMTAMVHLRTAVERYEAAQLTSALVDARQRLGTLSSAG